MKERKQEAEDKHTNGRRRRSHGECWSFTAAAAFWEGGALVAATSFRTKAKTAVAVAPAAFRRLPFMVYLFSHFVLQSLRRGRKKSNNNKIHCNLKKIRAQRAKGVK